MPLHLLGKKSWNVYNTTNIEKVRLDEALAAAREAVEEQRMQEVDAENRLRLLRGQDAASTPAAIEKIANSAQAEPKNERTQERKRRRIEGEDDTERDIRYAKEEKRKSSILTPVDQDKRKRSNNAPLIDRTGHISLFPSVGDKGVAPRNSEAEADSAKRKKQYEDQYTIKLSNAAGFKQTVGQDPWYFSKPVIGETETAHEASHNSGSVKGNQKQERMKLRLSADDPMAAMKRGVQGLREVEKARTEFKRQQKLELKEFDENRHQARSKKRSRRAGEDVQGFSLVDGDDEGLRRHHRRHSGHGSRHLHRRRHQSSTGHLDRSRAEDIVGWKAAGSGKYSSQFADG